MHEERLSLRDRVAVVTGGGGGIGRGIALAMASAGAAVTVGDIVPERCDETCATIADLGGRALDVPTDVMDVEAVRALVDAAHQAFGRVDILVNNAGGVRGRPFLEQSERSWRRHIDINLVSMLAATSAAAPLMIEGGRGGSIINVTSIEGSRAAPNYAVYAACKAGMISFTRSMALELSGHGVRVNAIAPDHTVTPGNMGNRSGPVGGPNTWMTRPSAMETMNRVGLSRMPSRVTGTVIPVVGVAWASSGWMRGPGSTWTLSARGPSCTAMTEPRRYR